jgi:ribosome-binding protein aMBF1 (putative translation factor)
VLHGQRTHLGLDNIFHGDYIPFVEYEERMAKNFRELQARMHPGAHARAEAKAEEALKEMALDELREAQHLTQVELAKRLRKKQPAISKIERSADMYISTLQKSVAAMGGILEIRAIFPETTVRINQFAKLRKQQA